jgi:hypothetical protein
MTMTTRSTAFLLLRKWFGPFFAVCLLVMFRVVPESEGAKNHLLNMRLKAEGPLWHLIVSERYHGELLDHFAFIKIHDDQHN